MLVEKPPVGKWLANLFRAATRCSLRTMNVGVIRVPYDSGHRGFRAGRGPDYLRTPFLEWLSARGREVTDTTVEASTFPTTEVSTTFELLRELAVRVGDTVASGDFPLVLSGNCNSVVGALGGLGSEPLAHLFFDGHGDFNTPETTTTGFLDGMGLATATGRCWTAMATSIPGFVPVPESRVALVGARDLDALEERAIIASEVTWVSSRTIRDESVEGALVPVLDRMRSGAERVYLHFDMDVLDPSVAHANRLSPPGGLRVEEVCEAVRLARERFAIAATSFASIEPDYDDEEKTLRASLKILEAVLG